VIHRDTQVADIPIAEVGLEVHAAKVLELQGITSFGKLLELTDAQLSAILGPATASKVCKLLRECGYRLKSS
jgi:hypothetical protein